MSSTTPKGSTELFVQRFLEYQGRVTFNEFPPRLAHRSIGMPRYLLDTPLGKKIQHTASTVVLWPPDELPECGVVRASGLVAETGSVVVDSGEYENSVWAIVPSCSVLILDNPLIYKDLDEYFTHLAEHFPKGAFLVSGPSRTADIEKQLVLGMHGPLEVYAVLLLNRGEDKVP